MVVSLENAEKGLSLKEASKEITKYFEKNDLKNKKVLVIVPDNTRSGPVGELFQIIFDCLNSETRSLDILIALGTHQPLSESQICKRLAISLEERRDKYKSVKFFNHEWEKPETFKSVGQISEDEVSKISNGLFRENVDVAVNKLIFDYDELLILGPVFPHEVVGFSGGHKYIFPGIAAWEIIDFFHWLGAVITNPEINGRALTPTREVVEKAASLIKIPHHLCAFVAAEGKLAGIFIGDTFTAWQQAADLSAKVHVVYKEKQYKKVLGLAPKMYDDLWTAGKVMYKLEPIVAEGGTLIIYAPHITEFSVTHGEDLKKIGFHTRDYFLAQMEKFKDVPRSVLAHSTHVKGVGTYTNNVEKPRINVVLATKISEKRCKEHNLGYLNPDEIDIEKWRDDPDSLVVDHAGEILHLLRD